MNVLLATIFDFILYVGYALGLSIAIATFLLIFNGDVYDND